MCKLRMAYLLHITAPSIVRARPQLPSIVDLVGVKLLKHAQLQSMGCAKNADKANRTFTYLFADHRITPVCLDLWYLLRFGRAKMRCRWGEVRTRIRVRNQSNFPCDSRTHVSWRNSWSQVVTGRTRSIPITTASIVMIVDGCSVWVFPPMQALYQRPPCSCSTFTG